MAVAVNRLTKETPREEIYGLTSFLEWHADQILSYERNERLHMRLVKAI